MKSLSRKAARPVFLLLAVIVILSGMAAAAYAYFSSTTNKLTNTLDSATVDIHVNETGTSPFAIKGDGSTSKSVEFTNSGENYVWLKVTIAGGLKYWALPTEPTGWTVVNNGSSVITYYYTAPIAPGASTVYLFEDLKRSSVSSEGRDISELSLAIYAEAIPYLGGTENNVQAAFSVFNASAVTDSATAGTMPTPIPTAITPPTPTAVPTPTATPTPVPTERPEG